MEKALPPLNGEGLVVPVLLGADDIDFSIDASFGHDGEVRQSGDLAGGIGPMRLINDSGGGVEVKVEVKVKVTNGMWRICWICWEEEGAQVRKVRNRRTRGDNCEH